jgi:branched-chain amino acid transport system permease protein
VEHFLGFAIPGIPYGFSYAIVAVSLVLTYQATGVFNFAFGAQAYASAIVFTWLAAPQPNGDAPLLPVWAAFLISVVIMAPLLGLLFDRFLFRKIANTNTTAKIVTSLALFVAIPNIVPLFFGDRSFAGAPSLLFNIDTVYFTVFGAPINGAFLATVTVTVAVLVAMVVLMRFTPLGLQMRAAVESRRLVQLDGVNAGGVVAISWAIASLLAGLAGVLMASTFGDIQPDYYASLMVAAIAAAAWGAMRSMWRATLVAVLIGVATTILQGYVPTGSLWYSAVLPAIPFIALVLALLFVAGLRALEANKDPLASIDPPLPPTAAASRTPEMDRIIRVAFYSLLAVFIVSMLTWIPITWKGVFDEGIALSIIFLSLTMITGMAGQLSLCQATFVGIGAITAAQLAMHLHINMLIGGVIGAFIGALTAVLLALLSLRLRGLGLALMTLGFALLFDQSVFAQTSVAGGQEGLSIQPSWYAPFTFFNQYGITNSYFIVAFLVLLVCVLVVLQVRKGTTGHFLAAMRGSETASSGLGINLTWQRIMVFALAGGLAAIGGVLYTIQQQVVNPINFSYNFSLAFVVIVITTGVSTVEGALQAGIGFAVLQQVLTYLPTRFNAQSLLFPLFAFGALTYAAHPEGIVEYQKRRSTARFDRLLFPKSRDDNSDQEATRTDSAPAQVGSVSG